MLCASYLACVDHALASVSLKYAFIGNGDFLFGNRRAFNKVPLFQSFGRPLPVVSGIRNRIVDSAVDAMRM